MKSSKLLFAVLTVLVSGLAGCAAETDSNSVPEPTGDGTAAIRGQDYEKIYYTDQTFTTEVGTYYLSCGNAPPSRSGRVTRWYIGTSTPCGGGGGARRACYEFNGLRQSVEEIPCPW